MLKKILMVAILASSTISLAAEHETIAAVNAERVRIETKAGKSIIQQLSDLQTKYKNKFDKIQQSFDTEKQELDKQKSLLSKEAMAKKEAEFNNKLQESRKEIQKEATKFDEMQQNAWDEFAKSATDIINNIAKDKKYSAVFSTATMVYMDPKIDITSQVIAAIDNKLDTIAVKENSTK